MSEHRALLAETAQRVFSDSKDWRGVEETGLPWVMVSEAAGGFDGGFEDASVVLSAAGRHAATLPIGEAIIAAKILSDAKLGASGSSLSLARTYEGRSRIAGGEIIFTGVLRGVAYGRNIERVAALIEYNGRNLVAVLNCADAKQIEQHVNPAGEPRDDLQFENVKGVCVVTDWNSDRLYRAMALARACQMSGAMDAALALAATHVRDRQQFGKPLASFQAIQQQMALFTEETAAARAACAAAARAADRGEASFEMACAKLRANQASSTATSVAHQVHGAIGFTREYDLQRFTRRLWAWRSEYGNDRHWATQIGARVVRAGSEGFWPGLVSGFAG